jgi:hypothetical protein
MYCQQNSVVGIQRLLSLARTSLRDAPIPAIAFNHWRTAENRTAIRYAARACLDSAVTPADFYVEYSKGLGIKSVALYTRAMEELNAVDAFCRDHLFNVGFCYVGCWTNPKGLSWPRGWKEKDICGAAQRFVSVEDMLTGCLPGAASLEARAYLRFLVNRLRCTVIHLQAVEQLLALHGVCDDAHPDALGITGKEQVSEHCRFAMQLAEQYMRQHAEAIEDRGCEGTLVSYYHTVPAYITHIQDLFLKDEPKAPASPSNAQPPAPGDSSRP